MLLEDHAGDILRKARIMNGISAAAVAAAANVSEMKLAALEADGRLSSLTVADLHRLAVVVGLCPEKYVCIATGWRPHAHDLLQWHYLRQFSSTSEDVTVNCYLIWDAETYEAALFDTGLEADTIISSITKSRLKLQHIFLTHTHWDHVEALPAIRAAYPDAQLHISSPHTPAIQSNQAGIAVQMGKFQITHANTPGHTEDGVTYFVSGWPGKQVPVAMIGDTLFAGSMGRGNQSWDLARAKIREHILSQPPSTLLCPGHGPVTTVAEEQANNPFF